MAERQKPQPTCTPPEQQAAGKTTAGLCHKKSDGALPPDVASGLEHLFEFLVDRVAERTADLVLDRLKHIEHDTSIENSMLVDVAGAAEYLAMPTSAIYKLSSAGKLNSIKVEGRLRFALGDLKDYVDSHRRSPDIVLKLAQQARAKKQ